jgi:HD-like signal output (HDOD) protein
MSLGSNIAIDDALRRLDHLAGLDDQQLHLLAQEVEVQTAAPGTLLLELGSSDSRLLFLLEGELRLTAGDGAVHIVRHTEAAAQGPVSRLRPSCYAVSAQTEVRYLMIEQRLLDSYVDHLQSASVVVEEALVAGDPNELIDDSATHPLMFDVFDDLNHSRVVLPSQPDVAIRVGRSLPALGADTSRLASTLSVCPALTVKVIRAAMASSPRRVRVRSAKEAVVRLGVEDTFELTVQCVLRESLRTDSILVRDRMHSWWERTIRVAAISKVLARMSERFDPEYAGLIGLLHSIAEPVMLRYADRHRDLADSATLDDVIYANRAQLGRILAILWGLPREVVEATTLCNHWSYNHSGEADYTDILLVAQWHAIIGGPRRRRAPAIGEIPAFHKLGLDATSPELSLKIVEAANSAIDHTDALLTA